MNGIGRFWSHKKGGKIYFHGIILYSNYCKIRSTTVGPAGSITIIGFFYFEHFSLYSHQKFGN